MSQGELSGLLLVDKPQGPTSHDLVRAVRKISGQRGVGHVGALDPLATGLMGLLLGPATRLAPYLSGHDKAYLATVALGLATDTDDVTGKTLAQWAGPWPSQAAVESALASFLGPHGQRPPDFSAKKVGGQVAHERARAGRPLTLAPQMVEAFELTLLAWDPPTAVFRATVSAGFYVRSLARDLGLALSLGGGALQKLRRDRIGEFVLAPGQGLPETRAELAARLLTPREALSSWPEVEVTASQAQTIAHGGGINLPAWPLGVSPAVASTPSQERAAASLGPIPPLDESFGESLGEASLSPSPRPLAKWAGLVKIIEPHGQLLAIGRLEPRQGRGQPPGPFLRPSRVFRSPKSD
ncbi:MAG: tRNA pseudouridine(55) synthase TruB [Deltaproteobacteria bacterium]|nr:tRNA pseudouridine(55) synthase TruB [Deltaproteobacteria bacterium]